MDADLRIPLRQDESQPKVHKWVTIPKLYIGRRRTRIIFTNEISNHFTGFIRCLLTLDISQLKIMLDTEAVGYSSVNTEHIFLRPHRN